MNSDLKCFHCGLHLQNPEIAKLQADIKTYQKGVAYLATKLRECNDRLSAVRQLLRTP